MKQRLKSLVFRLLGKEPEAVVVSFASGEDELVRRMVDEVRQLVPDRKHVVIKLEELRPGPWWSLYLQLRRRLRRYRVGLAPVLFTSTPHPLRLAAFLLAPRKILAYNTKLERHHLRASSFIASWLFLRGVPLDRIFLRPRWLCPWKHDRSVVPDTYRVVDGRPLSPGRPRVAVLSPYSPYPLSHGGAVRIYNLLREASREFDVFLFAFSDGETDEDYARLAEFCAKVILSPKPRYREPRWSTLLPPEVHEFTSPAMRRALREVRREYGLGLLQTEYTYLARYGGDILVEHDVTFDLFGQVWKRDRTLTAWWDYFRWRRFEEKAVRGFRRVIAMAPKDAELLAGAPVRIIENGVDLDRYRPEPEKPGCRLLFIGSFRHFPNVEAYRFFAGQVWPKLRARFSEMTATIVCGPDPLFYWREFTDQLEPAADERIRMLGFVRDVRPLYVEANIVIVPTTVSAGTNVKVLEAMAMQRAVVSTPSGCGGLELKHGESVWIAGSAADFAEGIARLAENPGERARVALAARRHAERNFDWKALGAKQRMLFRELQ